MAWFMWVVSLDGRWVSADPNGATRPRSRRRVAAGSADAESAHQVVQRRAADTQHLGCAGDVAVDLAEHLHDRAALRIVADLPQVEDLRLRVLDVEVEVVGVDELPVGHDHSAFHAVLDLADVAGPTIGLDG